MADCVDSSGLGVAGKVPPPRTQAYVITTAAAVRRGLTENV